MCDAQDDSNIMNIDQWHSVGIKRQVDERKHQISFEPHITRLRLIVAFMITSTHTIVYLVN